MAFLLAQGARELAVAVVVRVRSPGPSGLKDLALLRFGPARDLPSATGAATKEKEAQAGA